MATLLGLDLGTSSFKVSAYTEDGTYLGVLSRPTPWRGTAAGPTMDPQDLAHVVRELVDGCAGRFAIGAVAGIGVTGMAETMFVETVDGRLLPARAWNHRGHRAPVAPPEGLFARTGLVDAARTPLVELRRLTDGGTPVRSWSGLPERAVQVLGGERVAERSLAARTGLVDVVGGDWDRELFDWAGVSGTHVPDLRPAGSHGGRVTDGACAGAPLTVAGHDHVTAVIGAGADDGVTVFDSLGTGEAVIAPITPGGGLTRDAVERFTTAGFNVSLGVGDTDVIAFAGLGTGNRFNVLLDALAGAGYPAAEVMHAEHHPSPTEQELLVRSLPAPVTDYLDRLFGPRWQDLRTSVAAETVTATVRDLQDARRFWWAAVVRAAGSARRVLDALRVLTPHATRVVAAGGWLANEGVLAVRERVLGPFDVPVVDQCGARGAALLAGLAAGVYSSRTDFPVLATSKERS